MAYPSVTYDFTPSAVIRSTEVNRNFSDLSSGFAEANYDGLISTLTCSNFCGSYAEVSQLCVSSITANLNSLTTGAAPSAGYIYANCQVRGWARVGSAATILAGVNLTASWTSAATGTYVYNFLDGGKGNTNYAIVATTAVPVIDVWVPSVEGTTKGNNTFTVYTFDGSSTMVPMNLAHSVLVVG